VNTENMQEPFAAEQAQAKVIVGGRALLVLREAGEAPAPPEEDKAAPKKRAAKKKPA